MRSELEAFLRNFGVFRVGVADPGNGFRMAKHGCHPRDVMSNCNSVIVFAISTGLDFYVTLDYYRARSAAPRAFNVYCDWISSQLANFLEDQGYDAVVPYGYKDEKEKIARLSSKLAAYEAGLGVFGRSSLLVTPEFGPRVNLGVVITDASIRSDKPLKAFNPCEECNVCFRLCPIMAISMQLPPPEGFDRGRCLRFVNRIREKTDGKVRYCGYCFDACPVGKVPDKTLHLGNCTTLVDLSERRRKKFLKPERC